MKPQRKTILAVALSLALLVLFGTVWAADGNISRVGAPPQAASQAQVSSPQQAAPPSVQPAPSYDFALDAKLPVDSQIAVGRLPNGLRYWVRANAEPKNRAELRLVVRAGSVLENDDQQGLAHMIEHLAFNGTAHFPKQAIVDYMESIGMRFGAEVNAFTGFDETVYTLVVPTDSPETVAKALLMLEDWAANVTFDPAAVEKERGIIVEEWRLGQGADARMRAKQFPILMRGSRYADRMPIGKREVIESARPEALKAFYRTWYRPDLMAVVAVGDFDRGKMEEQIRKQFAGLTNPAGAPPRPSYPVPDHDETLFAIATDKEEPNSSVAVYHKLPVAEQSTAGAYRRMLVERLFNSMLNARFAEIAQKPDSPFLVANSGRGTFVESKDVYVLSALVPQGGIAKGLQALYAEGERVARFGFTATELERHKSDMLRVFENAFAERRTEDTDAFAEEFTRAFLQGEPTPGIAFEYEAHKRFLPGITLDEINRLATEWLTGSNRVVMVNAPDKPQFPVPTADDLALVLARVKAEDLAPYADTTPVQPLVAVLPQPGEIVARKTREDVGVTEWTLSNGARVVLKPTTFKEDEILLRATSAGGVSLASDADLIPANTADQVISSGGLGAFSAVDLRKKLAGKAANVRPLIGELEEGLAGTASPKDAETLFQLIYLTFTEPRADAQVFATLQNQIREFLVNRSQSPETVFSDTLRRTMQRDTPRFRPMTVDEVPRMNLEESLKFYRDRFADASDFTFIFVGNLDPAAIEPLVKQYLASLPATHRVETWKDWRVPPPDGVVKRTVEKGVEPKSMTALVFSGPFQYTLENRNALGATCEVLGTRLRKLLREKLSGTYDVSVDPSASKIPREEYRVSIDLGADPKRIDELSGLVFDEIKKLQTAGPDAKEVDEVRLADAREHEVDIRQNGYWMMQLLESYRLGTDPAEILRYPESLKLLTKDAVREAAKKYFDTGRYVQVTLYPEKKQ